jgi:SAM-dependent methyltransferase
MDWTDGYRSDIEYTADFFAEQSPARLNFACLLNGVHPVALDRPYTYFELGFGRGLTVNLLAAANPLGAFYATDFNPAHVAGAQELADQAGLTNITLFEHSFGDLAAGVAELPQFDFITMHGIYSWVSEENQRHIVAFLARYLKPGGIVYVSYNAMPGWSAALPLQRLLFDHAAQHPRRSDVQLPAAVGFVDQLRACGATYFTANPGLSAWLGGLAAGKTNYLVHEYLNQYWQPRYHADVAREFRAAKLDFVASATLEHSYPKLYLNAEQQALLADVLDPVARETIKDYITNRSFRKDVYVKGARALAPAQLIEMLGRVGLSLTCARRDVNLAMTLAVGQVNGAPGYFDPVLDAIADAPMTLGALLAMPALIGYDMAGLTQLAAMLVGSGQAALYFAGADGEQPSGARAMNRAITARASHGDELHALASPLLGSAILLSRHEQMVFAVLARDGVDSEVAAVAAKVWAVYAAAGQKVIVDGAPLVSDDENLVEVTRRVRVTLADKLPIWRRLRML